MNLELKEQAIEELSEFSPELRSYIWNELQELKRNPTGSPSVETIDVQGRTLFRYVMKENGRGGKLDHRAVFDIEKGSIAVFAVFHRDKGYQKDKIAKRF